MMVKLLKTYPWMLKAHIFYILYLEESIVLNVLLVNYVFKLDDRHAFSCNYHHVSLLVG
jgi:hypothetical protein